MVDPRILTLKAIIGVFVAAQVYVHLWLWPRHKKDWFIDDRFLASAIAFGATVFGFVALAIAYFLVFVW